MEDKKSSFSPKSPISPKENTWEYENTEAV